MVTWSFLPLAFHVYAMLNLSNLSFNGETSRCTKSSLVVLSEVRPAFARSWAQLPLLGMFSFLRALRHKDLHVLVVKI